MLNLPKIPQNDLRMFDFTPRNPEPAERSPLWPLTKVLGDIAARLDRRADDDAADEPAAERGPS